MFRLLPVFALAACAPDPASALPSDSLPPPVFVLSAPAIVVPGQSFVATVEGTLGEDEEVELLLGRGGAGAGPCLPVYGNMCLDVRSPVVIDRELVDANGDTSFTVMVPSNLAIGLRFGLQAAVIRGAGGARSAKSNALALETGNTPHGSRQFSFTGSVETFQVPAGVTSIEMEACAAQGGSGWNTDVDDLRGIGAQGGLVHALVPVTPGTVLQISVGGRGTNGSETAPGLGGFNGGGNGAIRLNYTGGGGGGATSVALNSNLTSRILVAGGGGAGSGWCTAGTGHGGAGGSSTGGDGQLCTTIPAGTGGTQFVGGSFGAAFGLGGSATTNAGAGGGGGYYGGGASDGSGGGGGNSFVAPGSTLLVNDRGGCTGDGSLTFTW